MNAKHFGTRLKSELERLGLDYHQIRQLTGISKSRIEDLLQRKSAPPSETLQKLASIPNLNLAYLKDGFDADEISTRAPTNKYEAAAQLLSNLPPATFDAFVAALTAAYQPFLDEIIGSPVNLQANQEKTGLIGTRLQSERLRIGITRKQAGALCGLTSSAVASWEYNKTIPPSESLRKLASTGIDIQYVVTGERVMKLTAEERTLITNLRQSPRQLRNATYAFVASFS